jgi:hypothetical protein
MDNEKVKDASAIAALWSASNADLIDGTPEVAAAKLRATLRS